MSRKRLSPLPPTPKDAPATMKRWMESVKESLEVRLGRRGDPGESGVTFNDLYEVGLVKPVGRINPITGQPVIEPGNNAGGGEGMPDFGPPPKPRGFTGVGFFGGVHLFWDEPTNRPDITFTEIMRGDSLDQDAATAIGGSGGRQYLDITSTPDQQTWYYWARHISFNGTPGPWSDALTISKMPDVGLLLDQLSGELADEPADAGSPNETFIINAKRFAVRTGPDSDPVYPLVTATVNGQPSVVIDTAFIQDGSIEEGKIGSISFGKITDSDGTPVTTVGGKLLAQHIDTDNLSVADAATFSGDVFSRGFQSGRSGWCMLQSGYVEFNEAMIRGNLEVQTITVNGSSPFGAIRCALSEPFSASAGSTSVSAQRITSDTISEMPENSRISLTINLDQMAAVLSRGGRRWGRATRNNSNQTWYNWSYSYYFRGRVRLRVRIQVDGTTIYDRTWQEERTSNTQGTISVNPPDIELEYRYPTYRETSTIRIIVDVEARFYEAGSDGSSGSGAYRIVEGSSLFSSAQVKIGQIMLSGDLFRLG